MNDMTIIFGRDLLHIVGLGHAKNHNHTVTRFFFSLLGLFEVKNFIENTLFSQEFSYIP